MKANKKNLETNNKTISYTHFATGSKTICFMFSGAGYNYDKPLFYYATLAMLEKNIDIVHIHYSYGEHLWKKPLEEISKEMMEDINPVILDVHKNGKYNETIFLGKSFGTIPIAYDLIKRDEFLKSKMIILTPLLKFDLIFDAILNSEHQGLLVIGDKDPHFNLNQIVKLSNSNLMIEVVQDANHSLDVGEYGTTKSLFALTRVMEKLQEVIKES
ncbi:alpha/beta hydrolase [Sutcliffiella halmapala]|uniref:alpha/beta hydrolase n=1 Tax=Sutcliffiella halmapala TaxID=79882 RepID=UPI000994BAD8|nr:alpha/beta hydrolase [Sutcliffiella halmapala]